MGVLCSLLESKKYLLFSGILALTYRNSHTYIIISFLITIWSGKDRILKYHFDVNGNCALFHAPSANYRSQCHTGSARMESMVQLGMCSPQISRSEKRIADTKPKFQSVKCYRTHLCQNYQISRKGAVSLGNSQFSIYLI